MRIEVAIVSEMGQRPELSAVRAMEVTGLSLAEGMRSAAQSRAISEAEGRDFLGLTRIEYIIAARVEGPWAWFRVTFELAAIVERARWVTE